MALYIGLGIGMMAADIGIQLVNNGISITKGIYNFGYTIIYGRPKSKEEILIEELKEQLKQINEKENENIKRIEELKEQIEQMKTHKISN